MKKIQIYGTIKFYNRLRRKKMIIKYDFLKKQQNEDSRMYYARLAEIEKYLWDDRKNNPENKAIIQECNNIIFDDKSLKGYAYQFLKITYPSYFENYGEDMIHELFLELFENIRAYDGSVAITTFAKRHFKHGAAKFISYATNKSRYYNEVYTKVQKVINKILASNEGLSEDDITDSQILLELPDYSPKQIHEAREVNRNSKREAFNPDFEAPSMDTPEQAFIEQQQKDFVNEILLSLEGYQREILLAHVGNSSYNNVDNIKDLEKNTAFLEELKKSGLGHLINIDKDGSSFIPQEKLKVLLNEAIQAARDVPVAAEIVANKNKKIADKYGEEISFSNEEDALETQITLLEAI